MKEPFAVTQQRDFDVAVAFLISSGIVLGLGGLWPALDLIIWGPSDFLPLFFLYGVLLTVCGFAMKQGRWSGWISAIVISVMGMAWFPIGTLLFGLLIQMLWRARKHPFLKRGHGPEKGELLI